MSEHDVQAPTTDTIFSQASWNRERTSAELRDFINRRHMALAAITVDE